MSQTEFLANLRAGIAATDPRKTLESIVAAAAVPDDDNDNDAAEQARLVRVKTLVNEVHAEKPDPRLATASTLLQQAIDQEKTEDADGA